MSNRRRRQQRPTTHKPPWYRQNPGMIGRAVGDSVKRLFWRRTVAIVAAVVIVVAGAATGLTLALTGGGGYHPVAFRIVYRVEDGTTNPHTITTQILDVRRPLYAAWLTRSGPPPGGALTGGSVEQSNYTQISSDKGTVKAQVLQPDIATAPGADLRLQPALGLAAAAGMVKRGDSKTVAGRSCVDFESHDPLDSGNWKLPADDGDVTSCVDDDGHLLSDVWTIHGKLVRSRIAVSFTSNPKPLPDPLAGVVLNNASSPLGITSAPLTDKISFATAIPPPPSGYRQVAARLVGYSDPQTGSLQSVARDLLYSNGDDVISVREQRSLGQPVSPPTGPAVQLPIGTAHWSYAPSGLTLTIGLDDTTQLRIIGSVDRDALLKFASSITKSAPSPSPSTSASP